MSGSCRSGCNITWKNDQIVCPCGGGGPYELDGTADYNAPSLEHYAMCDDGTGNVSVHTSQIVASDTRVE